HGKVLLRLSQLLANHLDAHPVGHAVSEVGLIVSEDTVLGPDLAFWTNERYPPESNCPRPGARYSRPDCRNSFSLRLSQPRDEENRNLPHGRRAAGLDCRPGNTLHNRVASQPARRYPDGQDSVVLFSDPNYWATKMAQGENRTSVGQ
ncbi:MAG: hypothetical protein RMI91_15350, partial [Gemmatales bacterium]|nr:hypothetical protein [Gemmatales bacterium]